MAFRSTPWAYLAKFEPAKAKRKILAAYKRAGGNAVKAAAVLGMAHRSLTRLTTALGLTAQVDAIRTAEGHPWSSKGGAA